MRQPDVRRGEVPEARPGVSAKIGEVRRRDIQFSQGDGGDGLDLMIVDEEAFDRMDGAAVVVPFDGVSGRVVSLDHLLAVKLHVLRQALPHRTGEEALDVEELVRRNRVPLAAAHYRILFLRYGDQQLYDTFLPLSGRSPSSGRT